MEAAQVWDLMIVWARPWSSSAAQSAGPGQEPGPLIIINMSPTPMTSWPMVIRRRGRRDHGRIVAGSPRLAPSA
jgi:hypothetical protein